MSKPARPDRCPLCGALATAAQTPFCSQGCRDRDLLNWLGEAYRVPARPDSEEEANGLDSAPPPPL